MIRIFSNKLYLLGLSVLVVIPWHILYKKYKSYKAEYEERLLFLKRHNSVVMYARNKGMCGWPPYTTQFIHKIKSEDDINRLYEPIIYFLNTAEKSLDVAYMMITIHKIFNALIEAQQRGVKVRLLTNFEHCIKELSFYRKCIRSGIQVQFYISHKGCLESIMHYKYMLKDYEAGKGGYVLKGSMNLTRTAFLNNYEHIVFSSDSYLAKSINNNFEQCWKYVELQNKTLLCKTILLNVNLK